MDERAWRAARFPPTRPQGGARRQSDIDRYDSRISPIVEMVLSACRFGLPSVSGQWNTGKEQRIAQPAERVLYMHQVEARFLRSSPFFSLWCSSAITPTSHGGDHGLPGGARSA